MRTTKPTLVLTVMMVAAFVPGASADPVQDLMPDDAQSGCTRYAAVAFEIELPEGSGPVVPGQFADEGTGCAYEGVAVLFSEEGSVGYDTYGVYGPSSCPPRIGCTS